MEHFTNLFSLPKAIVTGKRSMFFLTYVMTKNFNIRSIHMYDIYIVLKLCICNEISNGLQNFQCVIIVVN